MYELLLVTAMLTASSPSSELKTTPVTRTAAPTRVVHAPAAAVTSKPPLSKGAAWYVSWGYNTAQYAPVNIQFDGAGTTNDFTFTGAAMHDSKSWDIWNHPPTVPQYSLRVGKFITPEWAIELNFDHAKAILTQDRTVDVSGTINGAAVSQPMNVSQIVPEYQLNNGANFVLINAVRRFRLHGEPGRTGGISALVKAGGGFMIPHTQNVVLGQPNEEGFQYGGLGAGIEGAIRAHVWRTIYAEFAQKGFYGHYRNLNIHEGKAHQDLWAYVTVLQFGTTFNFHGQ